MPEIALDRKGTLGASAKARTVPHPAGIFDPVARGLDVIGDRWTLVLVRHLLDAPRGFQEIRKRTGIAPRVLSSRLRGLVAAGFVETVADGSRSVYALTEQGHSLKPIITSVARWWIRHGLVDLADRCRAFHRDLRPIRDGRAALHGARRARPRRRHHLRGSAVGHRRGRVGGANRRRGLHGHERLRRAGRRSLHGRGAHLVRPRPRPRQRQRSVQARTHHQRGQPSGHGPLLPPGCRDPSRRGHLRGDRMAASTPTNRERSTT